MTVVGSAAVRLELLRPGQDLRSMHPRDPACIASHLALGLRLSSTLPALLVGGGMLPRGCV